MRSTLRPIALGGILTSMLLGSGPVDVTVTPAIREYCHIVRFPQGWSIMPTDGRGNPLDYAYDSKYEFRVPGVLGTRFLVRGFTQLGHDYYTKNLYEIDLSDRAGIARRATDEEWQSGMKVPDSRFTDWKTFASVHLTNAQPFSFNGFQFLKTGDIWPGEYARLSPDRAWLVLLSSSGKVAKRDEFMIFGGRDKGKLFYDVFNADTGRKVITIVGTYQDIEPGSAINESRWVTERYFIVPLGEQRERCLVCDFGRVLQDVSSKP